MLLLFFATPMYSVEPDFYCEKKYRACGIFYKFGE